MKPKNYTDIMLTIIAVFLLLIVYNDYGLPTPRWFIGEQLPERVWVVGGSLYAEIENIFPIEVEVTNPIEVQNIYPIEVEITNPDDIAYENWLKLDGMSVTIN